MIRRVLVAMDGSALAIDHDLARAEARLHPAGQFLTAHGVRVALRTLASKAAPAELILDEVRRQQLRLIVMGAHGRHPVRDLFLTSVTRAVFKEAPVPVFVGA
jgi:nucleotide-binding universal stress UspA family protein